MKKLLIFTTLILLASLVTYSLLKTSSNLPFKGSNEKSPGILMKSLPVEISEYDPKTKRAGDLLFTNQKLMFSRIYMDYAFYIPASPDFPAKYNPQPTFMAPVGTKVRAIADGIVVNVPKLYSNDYTVIIGQKMDSTYTFGIEHVMNPTVRKGDTVKAGNIIGEVSDYDEKNSPGLGLVEIGLLKGGRIPTHFCPYQFIDPKFRSEIENSLKQLYTDWNTFKGETIYNLDDYETIGCLSENPIEDRQ